jgi:hypothetical protein
VNDLRIAVFEHRKGLWLDDGGGDVFAREGADRVKRFPEGMCCQFNETVIIASQ